MPQESRNIRLFFGLEAVPFWHDWRQLQQVYRSLEAIQQLKQNLGAKQQREELESASERTNCRQRLDLAEMELHQLRKKLRKSDAFVDKSEATLNSFWRRQLYFIMSLFGGMSVADLQEKLELAQQNLPSQRRQVESLREELELVQQQGRLAVDLLDDLNYALATFSQEELKLQQREQELLQLLLKRFLQRLPLLNARSLQMQFQLGLDLHQEKVFLEGVRELQAHLSRRKLDPSTLLLQVEPEEDASSLELDMSRLPQKHQLAINSRLNMEGQGYVTRTRNKKTVKVPVAFSGLVAISHVLPQRKIPVEASGKCLSRHLGSQVLSAAATRQQRWLTQRSATINEDVQLALKLMGQLLHSPQLTSLPV